MDIAAELMGIRLLHTKLLAFAVSSYYCGVAGALLVFLWYGGAEYNVFDINQSFFILFMVIIGGLGSLSGPSSGPRSSSSCRSSLASCCPAVPQALRASASGARRIEHLRFMIVGALIIFFLIVEPHGLARLWQIGKQKLRVWPFPYWSARPMEMRPETGRCKEARSRHYERQTVLRMSEAMGRIALPLRAIEACAPDAALGRRAPRRPARTRSMFRSSPIGPAPFAGSGIPIADGMHDYLEMLNERDGGIGGVKLVIEECETGYDTKKGIECYEAVKGKNPVMVNPWSTGITLPLIPQAPPSTRSRSCRWPTASRPRRAATRSPGCSTRRTPIGTASR